MTEDDIRKAFDMQPHPEGGWYVETFRDSRLDHDGRPYSTAIHFLLGAGDVSHWHRVTDAAEVWLYHAGAPLALTVSPNGHDAESHRLGMNLDFGERPQLVVPANWWQTATSLGAWTLVSCTVAPGFVYSSFEMAPPDWRPTPRPSSSGVRST